MRTLLGRILGRIMSRLYSLAWTLARPVLRRNRRLADGFAERLVPPDWAEPHAGRVDVWIQAASGGEARLACALLEALAEQRAGEQLVVLVTTWTRQGRDILDAGMARLPADGPVRAFARFVPFDDPVLMRRALAQTGVRLVVPLETELWPGMLLACKEAGVSVLLANGRLRDSTLRNYLRSAWLWRSVAPTRITAISEADAGRFARLFPGTLCSVISNIKFDQAVPPARERAVPAPGLPSSLLELLTDAARRPVVLFASVREEEEGPLCAMLREGLSTGGLSAAQGLPAARLIVAPRHMHRVEAWGALLDDLGAAWTRRSAAHAGQAEVILWDAFGELPWLYSVADAVFVGGSLAPLGGQNFLEALGAGLVPFVGPHLGNFAWALEDGPDSGLVDSGLLAVVPNVSALGAALRATVAHGVLPGEIRAATRSRFASWLASRQGGTAAQAALIVGMIPRYHA